MNRNVTMTIVPRNLSIICVGIGLASTVPANQFNTPPRYSSVLDPAHGLELKIHIDKRCVVDSLKVRGKEVLSAGRGIASGIKSQGGWHWSSDRTPSPTIRYLKNGQQLIGIRYGGGGVKVEEDWSFVNTPEGLEWTIDRQYLTGGVVDDEACPAWNFPSLSTWTGAILSTGGVAWCKLFDAPNASYGVHSHSAKFWNVSNDNCLEIKSTFPTLGMRFTRQPEGSFTLACEPSVLVLTPRQGQYRFIRDQQDVWKSHSVKSGEHVKVTFLLRGTSYRKDFDRGVFKGVDGDSVREIMNTIGRIGVIDDKIVGSNGWYSGYAVLHEPWFSLMALAVDDPAYTRNLGRSLDDQRDHAVGKDGMVKSRWSYNDGDATPGTYDAHGYYECQWGRLMDTQPSYVINVAELFDLNGDLNWVRGQKTACERALDYLLRRDSNGNGLVEMESESRYQKKSSDWLDVIYASFENGFVNAQMYRAMILWSKVETRLGDSQNASRYANLAAKLKASFNKTVDEGGFWDAKNQWYVYWRDKDGSVHGDNLTLPVNFMAIGYGLCDDASRRAAILDKVESNMADQKLFCWPVNIFPYPADEARDQPFPTYENGDIFLAWAELGIRAYSEDRPEIALKYLKNVLAQYGKDGLAFQRYLRGSQTGAGDDILANNCSAVVGLYRDVLGIQPQPDRLYIAPHVTEDLEGSSVRYWLRDRWYTLIPGRAKSRVATQGWAVTATNGFAIRPTSQGIDYYPGKEDAPSLSTRASRPVEMTVDRWGMSSSWRIVGPQSLAVSQTLKGLRPTTRYRLKVGAHTEIITIPPTGRLRFKVHLGPKKPQRIELTKLP